MDDFTKSLITGPAADAGSSYVDDETGCLMKGLTLPCGHRVWYEAEGMDDLKAFQGPEAAEGLIQALREKHQCPYPLMKTIAQDIENERERQDAQWGGEAHDDDHSQLEWLGFLTKQVMQAEQERTSVVSYRERLVKIAALAVAAIESHDRKTAK